jgi:Cu+-exporting ATPase
VVIFDKTGTLTEGRPSVTHVQPVGQDMAADEVLRLAVSLERLSEHPLAQAVVRAASEKNLPSEKVEDFANVAGQGVKGRIDNASVLVGNPHFMQAEGIKLGETLAQIESRQARAETVVVVARNGQPVVAMESATDIMSDPFFNARGV